MVSHCLMPLLLASFTYRNAFETHLTFGCIRNLLFLLLNGVCLFGNTKVGFIYSTVWVVSSFCQYEKLL